MSKKLEKQQEAELALLREAALSSARERKESLEELRSIVPSTPAPMSTGIVYDIVVTMDTTDAMVVTIKTGYW